ncbi:piwi-like protein 1 [Hyperolius riggenbachi]|uniref:piwi-like protein 1 n=1 Tax=Hyperolius riggenbachi TaxID=752182 RepID=UPI0035A2A640
MSGKGKGKGRGRGRGQEQQPRGPPPEQQPQAPQPAQQPPGPQPAWPRAQQPGQQARGPQPAWPRPQQPEPRGPQPAWPQPQQPEPRGPQPSWPRPQQPEQPRGPQPSWPRPQQPEQPRGPQPSWPRPQQPEQPRGPQPSWPRPQQPEQPRGPQPSWPRPQQPAQPRGPRPQQPEQQPRAPQPEPQPRGPASPQWPRGPRPDQPRPPAPASMARAPQPQQQPRAPPPSVATAEPIEVGAAAAPPAQPVLPQPELVVRRRGPPGAQQPEAEEVSAGFRELSLGERGGRRRDFHDQGVHTRLTIKHVEKSKQGDVGRAVQLVTNHIKLASRPQWTLYQYHIDFNPPMESRRLRTALLFHHEETIGKARAFDGAILFLPRRLPNKVTEVFSQTRNGEKVKVTITLTNELPPTSPTCFQFYNIIFRRLLKLMDMKQIGRNYYYPGDAIDVRSQNLTVWPGFATSILQYETSILLSIDVSHKVLRNETVLDCMREKSRAARSAGEYRDLCSLELVGQIVLTRYNNKTYRIDELNFEVNPRSTFKKSDGTDISYVDYYKTQYNIQIKDLTQPMIINVVKKIAPGVAPGVVMLVPELCNLTGLTDKMRKDFRVMQDLAVHTRLPPEQRKQQVARFLDYINHDEGVQKELKDWGLNFEDKLLSFTGRVLPAERIRQAGGRPMEYNPQFADWSRELRGPCLISAKELNNWMIIYPRRAYDSANALFQNLCKVTQQFGMRMDRARMVEVEDSITDYLNAFKSIDENTKMVVFILTAQNKAKYDVFKKHLCIDRPVPSQCVITRTLSKPQTLMSVCTKIALQMNCKMGGELWSFDMPFTDCMLVGIDIYHDTVSRGSSVAGFVASANVGATRWYSRCIVQSQKQEIVDSLKHCMLSAMENFRQNTGFFPAKIIIYRDGVGDGQLKALVEYELPQMTRYIENQCPSAGSGTEPKKIKVTVVVVKKRINARFFSLAGGQCQNPPPGTVIDKEVTRPEWYDFFIISQSVRQGTVSPTHYNVIYDSIGLKPNHMHQLTYRLCHMYYNWPGVIRVPAPCQYAHKLAFLIGQSVHEEPYRLNNYLYYL